jgi:hypothetical protein
MDNQVFYRSDQNDLAYRKMSVDISSGAPKTLNKEKRSVDVVAVTDSPVTIYDWHHGRIEEVLLMSGAELPGNNQLPLLDSHSRWDTSSVIGSFRDISTDKHKMTGTAYFSSLSEDIFKKVEEGHLTDFSVGYKVLESVWIPEKETQEISGRKFKGPLKVTTRWEPLELSAVPIGADKNAKARADKPVNIKKESNKMDEKFRAFLIEKGLPENATDEEAERFAKNLHVRTEPETDPKPDKEEKPKEEKREMIIDPAIEQARKDEIRAMCKRHNMPDEFRSAMIDKGISAEACGKQILDRLSERTVEVGMSAARILEDASDKFRNAAQDAVLMRLNCKVENPAPGAADLRGLSMIEIARQSLRNQNLDHTGNSMIMMGRAMTTGDFPYLLENVANKVLFDGFSDAPTTWQEWCSTGSVSDFKTYSMPRVSEADNVDEIPEGMPYKYGSFSEHREQYSVSTYGKMDAITRQMLINDDLNGVAVMLRKRGRSIARKLNALAYAVLTANAAMGDGTALFHADHGNLAAGGNVGVPGVATMTALELAMMKQQDLQSLQYLNIIPEYIIMPAALKGAAEIFFKTERYSDHSTVATDSSFASTRTNTWYERVQRIYDPVLDGTSATAWYASGPKSEGVTMFFLNGVQTPYIESKEGWTVDGMEYKARIDAAPKALSWENLYKNPGA